MMYQVYQCHKKGTKHIAIVSLLASTLLIVLLFQSLLSRSGNLLPSAFASARKHRTYTTRFRHTEDPISESSNWLNGRTDGLDWANVRTKSGLAYGTEAST